MPNSPIDPNNQKAILLTRQAHEAELDGKYKEAYDLHAQASSLLVKVVADGKKKSDERRRARLQLKGAQDRRFVLQACMTGARPPPQPLPSLLTIQREITHPTPGTILLSLVHMGQRAVLAEAPVPQQPVPQQTSNPPPLLTPLLSTSLPDVTYHVYRETIRRFRRVWYYFHVKDEKKTQILYTIQAMKRTRMQIPTCTMSRAAEYHNASAAVVITPVRPRSDAAETRRVGRPFKIITETRKDVQEAPDRLERYWNPRRFTYGGRRFVWKENTSFKNFVDTLYEVGKEWPDPKSKTGKILDEIHPRPLAWGDTKFAVDKICSIHMVGGLDQMFRELILVSQITKQMVSMFS